MTRRLLTLLVVLVLQAHAFRRPPPLGLRHHVVVRLEAAPEDEGGGGAKEDEKGPLFGSWPFGPSSPNSLPKFSIANFLGGSVFGVLVAFVVLFSPIILDLQDFQQGLPTSRDSAQQVSTKKSVEQEAREAVSLFDAILEDLRTGYVEKIDPKKLFETAVGAMLSSLDPYTEFETVRATQAIQESVSGKYGGVGLVITNTPKVVAKGAPSALRPPSLPPTDAEAKQSPGAKEEGVKSQANNGVTVVDAFEAYAFQGGMRVGDHLLSVDGTDTSKMSVEGVRDLLRGNPDTSIPVTFEREEYGGKKVYDVVLQRSQVKISDVRLACFLGDRRDRIGYINLAGFNAGAGRDFRSAFLMLKYLALDEQLRGGQSAAAPAAAGAQAAEVGHGVQELEAGLQAQLAEALAAYSPPASSASLSSSSSSSSSSPLLAVSGPYAEALRGEEPGSESSGSSSSSSSSSGGRATSKSPLQGAGLQGLVLDLRGNPGGLLDAAVEIASYLVPAQSDIVSARSREGPEILYRSVMDPIRSPSTRLVVLVNGGSASASEIVAGAIQDLDAGVVMGQSKTYGKGLVQKILPLPYDSALKYTIAKYYTPSGRCIQSISYSGGRLDEGEGESVASARAGQAEEEEAAGQEGADGVDAAAERGGSTSTSADGARTIRERERNTFLTASGRRVLDGGGINPDISVPPNTLAPSETLFLKEGLYSRFISSFIQSHDVLPSLHAAAQQEAAERDSAHVWSRGAFGPAVEQFMVYDASASPAQARAHDEQLKRFNAELYRGFRQFVQEEKRTNKLGLRLATLDKLEKVGKVREETIVCPPPSHPIPACPKTLSQSQPFPPPPLLQALRAEGLEKASQEVEALIPRLEGIDLLDNMEANNAQITTSLEIALLSREFPDRLLLREAIKEDPQIIAAVDVLKETVPGSPRKESGGGGESAPLLSTYDKALLPAVTASAPVPPAN